MKKTKHTIIHGILFEQIRFSLGQVIHFSNVCLHKYCFHTHLRKKKLTTANAVASPTEEEKKRRLNINVQCSQTTKSVEKYQCVCPEAPPAFELSESPDHRRHWQYLLLCQQTGKMRKNTCKNVLFSFFSFFCQDKTIFIT